jgi:hypothetical protein
MTQLDALPQTFANPYVGPRPFDEDERDLFFGREGELLELVSLVIAHRFVLFYGASGAGKTSLLRAGVIPALKGTEGFEVLPVARVAGLGPEDEPSTSEGNPFVKGLLTYWNASDPDNSLRSYLAALEHDRTLEGFLAPRAIVIDQLEELFYVHAERWPEREDFFIQLAEALDDDPLLRVVLSVREDYLAQLDPYERVLRGRFGARYRLEPLGPDAALRATVEPLRNTARSFAPDVAETLVEDLRTVGPVGGGEPIRGEFVEPVQLQVVCRSLWAELPPDAHVITEEHRHAFGNADEVLGRFYDDAITTAAESAHVRHSALRHDFEDAFITPLGTRGTVFALADGTGGIPHAAIAELERQHLIHAELRARARWYELTHDRLIEPVRSANRRYFAQARARTRKRVILVSAILVAAIVVALGVGLGVLLIRRQAGAPTQTGTTVTPVTTVTHVTVTGGSLFVIADPVSVNGVRVLSRTKVKPRDRVAVGHYGRAKLYFGSGGECEMSDNSTVITQPTPSVVLRVLTGSVFCATAGNTARLISAGGSARLK